MSVALHHLSEGSQDAPVLLLGGSLGTSLAMWERQRPLAVGRRLVSFDHRGHGSSPLAPRPWSIADLGADVLALMDRLGVERVAYAGLSLGGMVGMWLAAHAPERIERLVLLATAAHIPSPEVFAERARTVLDAGSTEPVTGVVAERWLTPAFTREQPDVHAELVAQIRATPAAGYAGCSEAIAEMDLRGDLARIRAPTLVISGAQDPATPVALQEEIAATIPGCRHEVVGPASHLVAVEQPAAVNRLILEHLSASSS